MKINENIFVLEGKCQKKNLVSLENSSFKQQC